MALHFLIATDGVGTRTNMFRLMLGGNPGVDIYAQALSTEIGAAVESYFKRDEKVHPDVNF